jgi:hypothetical protein
MNGRPQAKCPYRRRVGTGDLGEVDARAIDRATAARWRIGPGHTGKVISLVSHQAQSPASYKARLAGIGGLSHVTVEVGGCR